jgi:hypothetical protein
MKHYLNSAHDVAEQLRIAYVSANQLHIPAEVLNVPFFSRAQVIEHANGVTISGETLTNVAADESGSARYKVRSLCHR